MEYSVFNLPCLYYVSTVQLDIFNFLSLLLVLGRRIVDWIVDWTFHGLETVINKYIHIYICIYKRFTYEMAHCALLHYYNNDKRSATLYFVIIKHNMLSLWKC